VENIPKKKRTISAIVIDDDKVIVRMLSERLSFCGINVIGVGYNGKEAVELYQKLKPEIVFLDIMMPFYDGFYALQNIRLVNEKAKILMVTAVLRSDIIERLSGMPSVEVVDKTFDFDDLLNAINRLLDSPVDSMAFMGTQNLITSAVLSQSNND
jgi:two-component system, chemotaxis family, chemotaxis protein CheY